MKEIIGILFCYIFTYLLCSFVLFDLDAGNWPEGVRFYAVIFASAWSVLTFSYIQTEKKK